MKTAIERPRKKRLLEVAFWAVIIPGFALFVYGADSDGARLAYLHVGALLMVAGCALGVILFAQEQRHKR